MTDVTTREMIFDHLGRINALIDEAEDLSERKKDWRADCKSTGLDPKMIERVAKLQRADQDKLAEEEEILDLYKRAVGMG